MATDGEKQVVEESPAAKERVVAEVVTVELPAPPGWRKKFTPKKGGTPRRNEIVFMSPTGEEVKNKRQLDIYLRSHPGNPSSSEFDWGSGEAPRRSLRISEKAKATDIPEGEKPKKRERKSSSKIVDGEKNDSDVVNEAPAVEKDAIVETTVTVDEKMKEAEGGKDEPKEVISIETVVKERAVRQDSLDETKENIEEKTEKLEESSKVDPAAPASEAGENKDRPETEKPADAEILPPATDKKEEASAGKEMKIGDMPNNGIHKDNEAAAPKDAPSVNCDDGQH